MNFISSLIRTQVGSDSDPSPMLKSLIRDLGADKDDVELAQDITLLGLEVMDVIAKAVEAGNPKQAIWGLTGVISSAIPELEADIKKLTDREVQTILREIDHPDLVTALKAGRRRSAGQIPQQHVRSHPRVHHRGARIRWPHPPE